jgi:hypothetical protein
MSQTGAGLALREMNQAGSPSVASLFVRIFDVTVVALIFTILT